MHPLFRQFGLPALLLAGLFSRPAPAQTICADRLPLAPLSQPNRIEWDKFPAFTLPFTVIYGGPRFDDRQARPLQHGFSHIVLVGNDNPATIRLPQQRAIIFYGVATGIEQPWGQLESPWNNDLAAYRRSWDYWMASTVGTDRDATGKLVFPATQLVLDTERFQETDTRILTLKTNPTVPLQYRQLTDAQFVAAYKLAIRNLYAESIRYLREKINLTNVPVGSYSDVPIRNTWLNIPTNAWADWTTNLNRVSYLVKDSTEQRVGGPYFDRLDVQSPSAYYYYDYPSGLAPDYLAYLLFQVEANRAWSNKPIIPFVWLRYHDTSSQPRVPIRPWMAEATAIFPFFSGAAGLWLWEEPDIGQTRQEVYTSYEAFIHGLYRLSRFSAMFEPPYELVIETNARDLMDKQLPVWRGLVKNGKILIAAHNPYASETALTKLTVRYKGWQRELTLTGREVQLCQYDLPTVTATVTALQTEPDLAGASVSPNPARTEVAFRWQQTQPGSARMTLTDALGRTVRTLNGPAQTGTMVQMLSVTGLSAGVYVWQITLGDQRQTGRLVIH
jgi:hypothetical protein